MRARVLAQEIGVQIRCAHCHTTVQLSQLGLPVACAHCTATITPLTQLEQSLAQWYEPRRWRADLVEPNAYFLIERLWTAKGQGETLYRGISPKFVGYDIFCHMVTRAIARGVEQGWAIMRFPEDPLVEDPIYHLEFQDPDRFASEVEALFPDVNWDEQVVVQRPN